MIYLHIFSQLILHVCAYSFNNYLSSVIHVSDTNVPLGRMKQHGLCLQDLFRGEWALVEVEICMRHAGIRDSIQREKLGKVILVGGELWHWNWTALVSWKIDSYLAICISRPLPG